MRFVLQLWQHIMLCTAQLTGFLRLNIGSSHTK